MPTELFNRARPPACFVPKLTYEDVPRLRELLRDADKLPLVSWSTATPHVEELKGHFRVLLSDKDNKFDQLAKTIALQYLSGEPHVDPAVFSPMFDALAAMTQKFLETEESTEKPIVVPVIAVRDGKRITEVALTPLTDAEAARIFDDVPWREELEAYHLAIFCLPDGATPPDPKAHAIKKAANHLLWYADELFLDREPTTLERVNQ